MRLLCNQLPRQLRDTAFNTVNAILAKFFIDCETLSLDTLLMQMFARYFHHECWRQTIPIPTCSGANYARIATSLLFDFPELYWVALKPVCVERNVVAIEVDAELDTAEMQALQNFLIALSIRVPADFASTHFYYTANKDPAKLCTSGGGDCLAVSRLMKLALDREKTPNLIVRTTDGLHCLNQILFAYRFVFFDYYLFYKTRSLGTSQTALELCFDEDVAFTAEQVFNAVNLEYLQTNEDIENAIAELEGEYERVITFRSWQHLGQRELEQICRRVGRSKRYVVAYKASIISELDEEVTVRIMRIKL